VPSRAIVSGAILGVPLYTSTYWTFNVMVGMVLAIACLGLLVLVGWAREISLMQAGLVGSAMYLTFVLEWDYDTGRRMPYVAAALLGVAFAVAVSLLTVLVAVRLTGAYVIALTTSVQFLLEHTSFWDVGCLCEPSIDRPFVFGVSLRHDDRFYYLLLAVLAVCVLGLLRLRRSRFGRAMIMTGADPEAAAAAGVPHGVTASRPSASPGCSPAWPGRCRRRCTSSRPAVCSTSSSTRWSTWLCPYWRGSTPWSGPSPWRSRWRCCRRSSEYGSSTCTCWAGSPWPPAASSARAASGGSWRHVDAEPAPAARPARRTDA
jgi:hypothetical protein